MGTALSSSVTAHANDVLDWATQVAADKLPSRAEVTDKWQNAQKGATKVIISGVKQISSAASSLASGDVMQPDDTPGSEDPEGMAWKTQVITAAQTSQTFLRGAAGAARSGVNDFFGSALAWTGRGVTEEHDAKARGQSDLLSCQGERTELHINVLNFITPSNTSRAGDVSNAHAHSVQEEQVECDKIPSEHPSVPANSPEGSVSPDCSKGGNLDDLLLFDVSAQVFEQSPVSDDLLSFTDNHHLQPESQIGDLISLNEDAGDVINFNSPEPPTQVPTSVSPDENGDLMNVVFVEASARDIPLPTAPLIENPCATVSGAPQVDVAANFI